MKKIITVFFCMFVVVASAIAEVNDSLSTIKKSVSTTGPANVIAVASVNATQNSGYTVTNKDRISYGEEGAEKCKVERCTKYTDNKQKEECEACCEVTGEIAKWLDGRCECPTPGDVFITQIKNCVSGNTLISDLTLTVDVRAIEEDSEQNQIVITELSTIEKAIIILDEISKNFEDSVWKTAEGKFNTSRLISDSVAGVVLGTAGGLITSKVVKKNQVENGFEDIECSIGGQKVADWGDQFRVGIQ